jgi:ABC-type multidrug transport system ATPase subunit
VRQQQAPGGVRGRAPTVVVGVQPSRHTKTLLDGISGEACAGELLAIMGASGSGKSTLVDALAGRIARESLRGGVTLNGEPLQGRRHRAISAYVMQDDLLYPMLTVRETLHFAAEFRLPRALSPDRKRARRRAHRPARAVSRRRHHHR